MTFPQSLREENAEQDLKQISDSRDLTKVQT